MYNTNRKTGIDMKQRLAKFANCIPLWMQLSFFILIISTVTIFTLIFRNFTSIRNLTISNQYSLSQELLDLESENLDRYISELANFCIQPYYDNTFTRIINQKKPLSSAQIDYMKQQMYYYYYSRNDIQAYEIYLINQDLSIGRTENQEHIRVQSSPQFDTQTAASNCSKDPMFQSITYCDKDNAFFTYCHSLFQIKGQTQQALVHLQVNTSYLKQMLQNHQKAGSDFIMLNADNEFIYSSNTALFGANDSIDEFFTTQRTLKNGAITVEINGKDYLMVSAKSQKNNIQLINLIPLSIIDAELKGATSSLLINGICIWLITIFLVYLFTYLLTKPLKTLSERMQYAGSGDFHTFPEMHGSSEIAELSHSFNSMLRHIEQLIQQNYIAKLSEKNARLTALEAQLNPHFLYNTLQAISTEALINDQFTIHRMITSLASNLRYTIKGGDLVPLKSEVQYLSDYIYLLKMRMNDALVFNIDTEPELDDYMIPKISLQALVENSIIHGKSTNKESIEIKVTLTRLPNDRLQISVYDNGCGISQEQQNKLYQDFESALTAKNPGGIGLANLYVRLHLLYNEPTDLKIESAEHQYTNIILTLPCVNQKEDNHV